MELFQNICNDVLVPFTLVLFYSIILIIIIVIIIFSLGRLCLIWLVLFIFTFLFSYSTGFACMKHFYISEHCLQVDLELCEVHKI
ncbi:hypothetical protein FKM82_022590 [Ascaphus truei]